MGMRARRVWWSWPAGLLLVLTVPGIGRPGLWADELATWGAVRLDWGRLWALLSNTDAVNGGYYLVMKLWTAVAGTSEAALRLPSAVAMACAATGAAVLAARWWGRGWGMLAGCCFAVLPVASRYAQEARAYAFVIAAAVWATWLLVRLRDRPTRGGWIGYGALLVAIGAGHLIALLVLLGHAAAVAGWWWRTRAVTWRAWTLTVAVTVTILAPLAVLGQRQIGQTSWIEEISWHSLTGAGKGLFGAQATALLIAGLVAVAVIRWHGRLPVPVWAGAVLPVAGLLAISILIDLWFPRYLLFTVPAWIVLAVTALLPRGPARPPHWAVAAGLVLAIAGSGIGAQYDIRRPSGHGHDTLGAAGVIAAGYRPGDGFAVALDEPVVPWEARDLIARYVPADHRPADVFATSAQRESGNFLATECADLAACLGDTPRLWIVRYENPADPLTGIGDAKETLLRDRFRLVQQWPLRGLTVALLDRNPTPS